MKLKKVGIFIPAYNVEDTIGELIEEFGDIINILKKRDYKLSVMILNDCSTDGTRKIIDELSKRFSWLLVEHNRQNRGNSANIIAGYKWGVEEGFDIIGCMDADGEHSPYALLRHLRLFNDEYDGLAGSIIFPEHDANYHDRNMMRYYGGLQADIAGVEGLFYIQSPGYNLHKRKFVERALKLLDEYKRFFEKEKPAEEFPCWGMHGVFIHLLSRGAGAKIKALYLECFGQSPNRTPEKILKQGGAAQLHCMLLPKFLGEAKNK